MAEPRIYAVRAGDKLRLVRATHPSTALRHVAADTFKVSIAKQEELVAAIKANVAVEDAKPEQQLPT